MTHVDLRQRSNGSRITAAEENARLHSVGIKNLDITTEVNIQPIMRFI
jgi:hypothetical protein